MTVATGGNQSLMLLRWMCPICSWSDKRSCRNPWARSLQVEAAFSTVPPVATVENTLVLAVPGLAFCTVVALRLLVLSSCHGYRAEVRGLLLPCSLNASRFGSTSLPSRLPSTSASSTGDKRRIYVLCTSCSKARPRYRCSIVIEASISLPIQ